MMKRGNSMLSHSQVVGIVWLIVVSVVIVAVVIFSPEGAEEAAASDTSSASNRVKLEKMEDSVYRSRGVGKRQWRRTDGTARYPSKRGEVRRDTGSYYAVTSPSPTRQPLTVELNGADTTTLQLLHGIGPVFARRIVRYRERLGGFTSTEQLLEVYGFTPQLLDHIRPYLRLDADSLRRINVNTMSLKQLIKHPYMDYYFARDLVRLRSRGVTFASPDDLRIIPSCNDTLLTRLLPYLDFGQ